VKIAILQERIGIGGRSKVLSELVKAFNNLGVVPRIFTFSTEVEIAKFENTFNISPSLSFQLCRPVRLKLRRGTTFQAPLLNLATRRELKTYDLVVTSNSCPHWLPEGPHYVHYVHHPPEAELIYGKRYHRPLWKPYAAIALTLYKCSKIPTKFSIFLANSGFTKRRMLAVWRLPPSQVKVVYPPTVELQDIKPRLMRNKVQRVVTVGSFLADKEQLLQILIAKDFPHLEFHLIGKVASITYFKKCQRIQKRYNICNVKLLPSLSNSAVRSELLAADIFLHTRMDEHFGISTVEAIAYGCIPLVHDSGGQREVVPIPELRFRTMEEAKQKLSWIAQAPTEKRIQYMESLQKHITRFATEVFRETLLSILDDVLSNLL